MRELDFLLLQSVIFCSDTLCMFAGNVRQPKSEIAVAAYELFLKGYLSVNIYYEKVRLTSNSIRAGRRRRHLLNKNKIEVRAPSLKDIYISLDCTLTIWYSLTPEGGQYLEKEALINWNLFCEKKWYYAIPANWLSHIYGENNFNHKQKRNVQISYSINKSILETWILEKKRYSSNKPITETVKWHVLKNKKILYWKEMAQIHVLSFYSELPHELDFIEKISPDITTEIYGKYLKWYTVPTFDSPPPSKLLLAEYFEYYHSEDLNDSEWKIEYVILKIGISYMEEYNYPTDLYWGNYFDGMTQAKTLISLTSMFDRRFIEATILDWTIPKTCNTEIVATKVFLNKVGVQSVLDYQLMAKYSVTEAGSKYFQFLEKTHQNLPKTAEP